MGLIDGKPPLDVISSWDDPARISYMLVIPLTCQSNDFITSIYLILSLSNKTFLKKSIWKLWKLWKPVHPVSAQPPRRRRRLAADQLNLAGEIMGKTLEISHGEKPPWVIFPWNPWVKSMDFNPGESQWYKNGMQKNWKITRIFSHGFFMDCIPFCRNG